MVSKTCTTSGSIATYFPHFSGIDFIESFMYDETKKCGKLELTVRDVHTENHGPCEAEMRKHWDGVKEIFNKGNPTLLIIKEGKDCFRIRIIIYNY